MKKNDFYVRLDNPGVVRVYAQMIRIEPIDVVRELYNNLKTHAHEHPKFTQLKPLFVERLGNE